MARRPWLTLQAQEPVRKIHYHTDNPEDTEKCLTCPLPDCVECMSRQSKAVADMDFHRFLALCRNGLDDRAVAEALGVPRIHITRIRRSLHLAEDR